jgi:hypothetical protein
MAYAPLVGQDGGSGKDDLPDGKIEIFLREDWTDFCSRKVIFPSRLGKNGGFQKLMYDSVHDESRIQSRRESAPSLSSSSRD